MANRYQVIVRWKDPRSGPQHEKYHVVASHVRAAIGKALGDFFRDRKDRGDHRGARAALTAVTAEALRVATQVAPDDRR